MAEQVVRLRHGKPILVDKQIVRWRRRRRRGTVPQIDLKRNQPKPEPVQEPVDTSNWAIEGILPYERN